MSREEMVSNLIAAITEAADNAGLRTSAFVFDDDGNLVSVVLGSRNTVSASTSAITKLFGYDDIVMAEKPLPRLTLC